MACAVAVIRGRGLRRSHREAIRLSLEVLQFIQRCEATHLLERKHTRRAAHMACAVAVIRGRGLRRSYRQAMALRCIVLQVRAAARFMGFTASAVMPAFG